MQGWIVVQKKGMILNFLSFTFYLLTKKIGELSCTAYCWRAKGPDNRIEPRDLNLDPWFLIHCSSLIALPTNVRMFESMK